jgi:outer membrane receptor protein involved in Fe transport
MPVVATLFLWSSVLLAQEKPLIEEIMVTAQRVEESLQRVPVAASAFTDTMIDDRQIVGLADLQLNVPNLSFRDNTFGRGRYIIRGVGRNTEEGTAEEGVAVYINGIPVPAESNFDFIDMERIEVMRGPQGTLYGRNATGGAINMVTKKPITEAVEGFFELEYGDYEHRRLRGAVNLPISDRLAFRAAGMDLKRDGFTENLAGGQVEGVDDDMDGRDLWTSRITAKWWITDELTLTLLHSHFEEDDDRLRTHALVCKQNPYPTLGCIPGEAAFEPPHPHAFLDGVIAADLAVREPGARDASTGLSFDFPRPDVDLRHQHTDFEPIYERNEDFVALSLDWKGDRYSFSLSGGHYDQKFLYRYDDRFDVGWTFPETPAVPSGLWPTASQPFGIGGLFTSTQCNINDGTGGLAGGCVWPADQTRHFTYNSQQDRTEQTTVEARIHTRWDGPINFVVGGNYLTSDRALDFQRFNNVESQLSLVGSPLIGFPFPFTPGFFDVYFKDYDFESYSAFGEVYWQATETLKVTAGLRYNNDAKSTESTRNGSFQGVDVTAGSDEPEYIRTGLLNWFFSGQPQPGNIALTDLYGATEAILSATDPSERLRAFQIVPVAAGFNELRNLSGVPSEKTWEDFSARFGVSWTPTADRMFYAFYSRGYKPGNFGVLGQDGSEEETVNTIELGTKMRLADGHLQANLALFWNDYAGLQLDALSPNQDQLVRDLDAESWGAEVELEWRPSFLPNAQLHVAYSWLHSEVASALAVDELDMTLGNPDYVLLLDYFSGPFIARREEVLPLVEQAADLGFANPAPNTVYPDGIPALFSSGFLNAFGVDTSFDGLTFDLKGNEIPSAPEHTLSIGASYSWHLGAGSIRASWDYYWQDDSFSRVNNFALDRIDAWHHHNASLAFESASGRWAIKGWARNLTNEDNVNHHVITRGAIVGARNYTINDPRLFGVTLRVNFGI